MGEISCWYLWTIWVRKKMKNLMLKKSKISGLAQNSLLSANWILRVANFGPLYLWHFFINLEILVPFLLKISWIFQNTPNIFYWNGFEGSYGQKPTNIRNQKICHFKPTQKCNLFWGWDFSTFFLLIWFKSTKMKFRPYFTMEKS